MAKTKSSTGKWLDRIDSVQKITRDLRRNYKQYLDYYRGIQHTSTYGNLEPMVINYVYNTIRTIVPTLYFKNPRIYSHATRPEFVDRVPLVNLVANYDLRILNIKNEIKRSILRSQLGGIAWIETAYSFEAEQVEEPAEEGEVQLTTDEMLRPYNEPAAEETSEQYSDMRVKKDSPIVISRSLMEVATDPFVNQLEEMAWYAIKEIRPLDWVKKDPRYHTTRNLQANAKFDDVVVNDFSETYRKDNDLKFVELWHITDRWEGTTFTVARGQNGKLREFDTPEGYDLVPMFFNEDPESPNHISTVSQIRDIQDEINRHRMYMLEHTKRTLPRMVYDSNVLNDQETINRITNSEHMEILGVPGGRAALEPLQFPSLSPDMYNVDAKLVEDMRIGSGLSDFQRGAAIKTPSATEAQIIEQSSRLRVDEGLDIVSDAVERVAKNTFKLRQQFTQGEKIIPIIGQDNIPVWGQVQSYDKERIQGDYEFTVDYGSTQKRDQDYEKNLWIQATPVMANLMAQAAQDPRYAVLGRQLAMAFELPQAVIDELFPTQQGPPASLQAMFAGGGQLPGQQIGSAADQQQDTANVLRTLFGGGEA